MRSLLIAAVLLTLAHVASADPLTFEAVDRIEQERVGLTPYAFLIAGEGTDAATTMIGWSKGATELNPVIGSTAKRLLIEKSIASGVLALVIYALGNSHPTIARVLGYVSGSVSFGVAAHNATVHTN